MIIVEQVEIVPTQPNAEPINVWLSLLTLADFVQHFRSVLIADVSQETIAETTEIARIVLTLSVLEIDVLFLSIHAPDALWLRSVLTDNVILETIAEQMLTVIMFNIHYALTISALFHNHPLLPQEPAEEMMSVQEITNAVEEDASK